MSDEYTAVYDAVAGFWVVSQGDNYRDNARFYGDTAEQDASAYAAELNSREPKIELPTEPGWYLDDARDALELREGGQWYMNRQPFSVDIFDLRSMPFTRLYTESEVREARAQAVESMNYQNYAIVSLALKERAKEIRAEGQA
jgi:hypothetical protein